MSASILHEAPLKNCVQSIRHNPEIFILGFSSVIIQELMGDYIVIYFWSQFNINKISKPTMSSDI